MSTKTYSNENTVALWEKTAKSGNTYLSGTVYVGNVPYRITLFANEATSETHPVYKGKIEIPDAK
ncbi:MAG: hypothetical protein ACRCX7_11330 [Cetobacterium sp.]|uniref:hypothetical protein n=1 Tax=Cetobacterium sp. TaxID=2071632 RepID=UPI003F2E7898